MRLAILLLSMSVAAAQSSIGDRLIAGIWLQKKLPLNSTAAAAEGWTEFAGGCSPVFGRRFRLGSRLTPTLMYDNTGALVGLQSVVNTSTFPLFPSSNLRMTGNVPVQPVHQYGDKPYTAALTVHFADPTKLCSATIADHKVGSVGDRFWIRNGLMGSAQADFTMIPLRETDLNAGYPANGWKAGGCAPTGFAYPGAPGMGTHYWQYLSKDVDCVNAGPLFLLYDKGVLGAFGLTFVGTAQRIPTVGSVRPVKSNPKLPYRMPPATKSLWEFASQPLYPFFFHKDENPTCLQNLNTFNGALPNGNITTGTLHFFLTDPFSKTCDAPKPRKFNLASQLPCDRSYKSPCATFNAVSLTGHMVTAIMVSSNVTRAYGKISTDADFRIGDFYGWVYSRSGVAVAHGNGGVGRVLTDTVRSARLSTALKGGGFVDYGNGTSKLPGHKDSYGSEHGSYVLPIYGVDGALTHFAGVSFSTKAAPSKPACNESSSSSDGKVAFIALLVIAIVLFIILLVFCFVYCILRRNQSNLAEDDAIVVNLGKNAQHASSVK